VPVVHVVAPNRAYMPDRIDPETRTLSKRWSSCWYEAGGADTEPLLGEKGYDTFPVVAGRWAVTGTDTYGSGSPGMFALSDARELQELAIDSSVLTKQMGTPPLSAPAVLFGENISLVPGRITYLPNAAVGAKVKPLLEVDGAQLQAINAKEALIERRVGDAYYNRIWALLQEESGGTRRTATEIHARKNEELTLLGPLTIRFQQSVLRRTIELVWSARQRAGLVKPYPQSLVGKKIKLVFRSEFSQAQRASQALALDRLVEFTGKIVEITQDPSVFKKLDKFKMIDLYADGLGVAAEATVEQDKLDQELAADAQQKQDAMEQAKAAQESETIKNLAGADMSGDNGLTRATQALQQPQQGGLQ
jgi:hypothetical protein